MRLLFDSDVVIRSLNNTATPQANELLDYVRDAAISIITRIEVLTGAAGSAEKATSAYLKTFIELAITQEIAERTVQVRRETRLKLPDAIIYATALATHRTLVTYNTRDFHPGMPAVLIPS